MFVFVSVYVGHLSGPFDPNKSKTSLVGHLRSCSFSQLLSYFYSACDLYS